MCSLPTRWLPNKRAISPYIQISRLDLTDSVELSLMVIGSIRQRGKHTLLDASSVCLVLEAVVKAAHKETYLKTGE